jgi:hypothetical protein
MRKQASPSFLKKRNKKLRSFDRASGELVRQEGFLSPHMHCSLFLKATMFFTAILANAEAVLASTITPICTPKVGAPVIVASYQQRAQAAARAQPPLTDIFAWPDTPISFVRSGDDYLVFGSDGGNHAMQSWSITTVLGTLDNPLGSDAPRDVSISPNPDPSVNPNYASYSYMGAGPVWQVPSGMIGAGNLLAVYHAEILKDQLYPVLGLAYSIDLGRHWTDLGEIIRLNQAFSAGLGGFEIGDAPLVPSPDGKFFYIYFPNWIASGSRSPVVIRNVSVARAPIQSVLQAAFGERRRIIAPFEKYFAGSWHLQPGLGGDSEDLIPVNPVGDYIDVHYNAGLARYVMILSNDNDLGYAESLDGLNWSVPQSLGSFGNPAIAAYPTAVGLGVDPAVLSREFNVYFTHLPNDGTGWQYASLQRIRLSCP